MAKYSYEFKKRIVMEYLEGKGGAPYLSKKYGLGSDAQLQKWVNAYKALGNDGLTRSRQKKTYPFEVKLSVVELYLTTEVSYQELGLSFGIKEPSTIARWVNDYRIVGPDALREKTKGRRGKMVKSTERESDKKTSIDEPSEYLKQLEAENLKLKIENAYLKELRRLRLEREALNKKRELSVTSEENSN